MIAAQQTDSDATSNVLSSGSFFIAVVVLGMMDENNEILDRAV